MAVEVESPGRRARKKEETRERILEVALGLFQGQGFRRTTMRRIAEDAGIALGTTYNYFATKEHIALYFFEQALGRVLAKFEAEREPGMGIDETLFLLITLQLEEIAPYESFLHLMVGQAADPDSRLNPASAEVQRLKDRYLEVVAGVLREAREQGLLPPLGPDAMVLEGFWIFHLGALLYWLNDASPEKEDTLVFLDKVLRFTVRALQGETA